MKDISGKEVVNGDIMIEGHEDHAYVFEVKERKPILVALISVEEKLEKFTIEDINKLDEEINRSIDKGELGKDASFMRSYYKKMIERMETITTDELVKAADSHELVIKKFLKEGYESIVYETKLDDNYEFSTIVLFPNEEKIQIVGGL